MEFIKEARAIHGYNYSYHFSKYKNKSTNVLITCDLHGHFSQRPSNHINRMHGCLKCSGNYAPTTEEWIETAQKVHGEKYDYSKVVYKKGKEKVIIICPIHGEFNMSPNSHIKSKTGCAKCVKYGYTTEEWIALARKAHSGKYTYDNVIYQGSNKKVSITCSLHGDFLQLPAMHLYQNECPKCNSTYPYTTKEWVKMARKLHEEKYDYSKVEYVNSLTNVIITCPIHGDFKIIPSNHISKKNGCSRCGKLHRHNIQTFLEKATKKHGDRYDYSKVEYVKHDSKIIIICALHGEFTITPANHFNGGGCQKCVGRYSPTTEEWAETARKIHQNKYDYSKAIYENNHSVMLIICPKHGEFKQVASTHLQNCGCPKCRESTGERYITKCLGNVENNSQYKIQPYSYDFYIPSIKTLIEYDGEQHFKCIEFFNKHNNFEKQKQRDLIKTKLAIENGFYIVRIPYTSYKEIPNIISDILQRPRNLLVKSNNEIVNSIYEQHQEIICEFGNNSEK